MLIGVPSFFLLREYGGNTLATLGMMILMLPLFFLAMYEKNGQPLEKFLNHYIQARFIRPKVRPYRTANYFALLQQQAGTGTGGRCDCFPFWKRKKLRP